MIISREAGAMIRGPLPENTARTSILIAMLTIAIYMSFLVDLKVLTIFKRRNTLYFWSLLITSWGIIGHSLGVILKWFVASCPWEVYTAFSSFGWWGMVTGQSLVLYSRLHLVVRNQRLLRAILIMISVDFCLFQVPTSVQKFGSTRTEAGIWLTVYHVYERIQLVVFTLQELVISIVYIRAAVIWLSPSDPDSMRRTKHFLIYLNILCIALDIAIICEAFSHAWIYEEATQSLAYAIKLTLEFAVLNEVMEVYRLGPGACTTCHRRFTPRSFRSFPEYGVNHGSRQNRPRPGSFASNCLSPTWPKGKPRGSERLASFTQEESVEGPVRTSLIREVRAPASPTTVRLGDMDTGKTIIVTTGIATSFEGRDSGDSV